MSSDAQQQKFVERVKEIEAGMEMDGYAFINLGYPESLIDGHISLEDLRVVVAAMEILAAEFPERKKNV